MPLCPPLIVGAWQHRGLPLCVGNLLSYTVITCLMSCSIKHGIHFYFVIVVLTKAGVGWGKSSQAVVWKFFVSTSLRWLLWILTMLRWEDRYHSCVCAINMRLQPAVYLLSCDFKGELKAGTIFLPARLNLTPAGRSFILKKKRNENKKKKMLNHFCHCID